MLPGASAASLPSTPRRLTRQSSGVEESLLLDSVSRSLKRETSVVVSPRGSAPSTWEPSSKARRVVEVPRFVAAGGPTDVELATNAAATDVAAGASASSVGAAEAVRPRALAKSSGRGQAGVRLQSTGGRGGDTDPVVGPRRSARLAAQGGRSDDARAAGSAAAAAAERRARAEESRGIGDMGRATAMRQRSEQAAALAEVARREAVERRMGLGRGGRRGGRGAGGAVGGRGQ